MPLMTSCRFFCVLSPLLITLEFVQQHLRRDLLLWCRRLLFLLRLLAFSFIGHYLSFGVNSSRLFGRFRCEHLCLPRIPLHSNVYHVSWEWVSINLHRHFGCLKLEPTLLYSRLYLLTKHFALICIMRCRIVPLVVLDICQLLICRDLVIRL